MPDIARAPFAAYAPPIKVSDEKYSGELAAEGQGLFVRFRGTISTPNPSLLLNPFVDAVHERIAASGPGVVTVDLHELEFCNSSGFKAFIYWIQRLQELPEPAQYRLRFLLSPTRRWQRTSLLALTCFAPSRVELQ